MFDLTTAATFVVFLSLIQLSIAFLFTLLARSFRGTLAWTWAGSLGVVGSVLYGLRGIIPDLFAIVIANSVNTLALCALYFGVRQFLKQKTSGAHIALIFALPLAVALTLSYFTFVQNNIVIRSTVMSGMTISLMAATAYLLFYRSDRNVRRSHWFTGSIFVLFALFQILRLIPFFMLLRMAPTVANDLLVVLPLMAASIYGILWTAGISLMITERLVVELQHTATHDFLTTTLNRRAAHAQLEAEVARARQQRVPLSILLLDVDHFKAINDRYGHEAGDAVLVTLVERLHSVSHVAEGVGRWGGEEFLMILPSTPLESAYESAKRVNSLIADTAFTVEGTPIHCSVSIGVASSTPDRADVNDLLRRADRALYHAKRAGRNRVSTDTLVPAEVAAYQLRHKS